MKRFSAFALAIYCIAGCGGSTNSGTFDGGAGSSGTGAIGGGGTGAIGGAGSSGTGAIGGGGASGTGTCENPPPACSPVTLGELDGQWLLALSTTIAPTQPILFFADVATTPLSGSQLSWRWTLVPLDAQTRTPIAGATPIALPASPIPCPWSPGTCSSSGPWFNDLPPLDVPGAANPITGSDITADTALTGDVCGGRVFLCGDLSGTVTKPIMLDLAGSTWAIQRLPAPNTLPQRIYVGCSCVQADPPG